MNAADQREVNTDQSREEAQSVVAVRKLHFDSVALMEQRLERLSFMQCFQEELKII